MTTNNKGKHYDKSKRLLEKIKKKNKQKLKEVIEVIFWCN